MKTSSKLIVLTFFLAFAVIFSGCAATEKLTSLSGKLSGEDGELAAKEVDGAGDVDNAAQEEGIDEELLEERVKDGGRELPDILKDDPELIRRALETGTLYTIYFNYDSYSIGTSFLDTIKKNAHWIKSNPKVSIILEGHADERGGNEYNLALSERRAQGIEKFLIDYGVNKRKLATLSYGEEKPAIDEHNEAAWKKNRRVEVKILN